MVKWEEWGEKPRFSSCQGRMWAEKAGLHFPECSWPCLPPGERLRDPATSSSLLLNYSDYYLFVVFLHLTACLVHLIGGLLPYLPVRQSPAHYWGLFISSEAAAAHPAALSPPAQAAGGDGGKRAGATAGPPTATGPPAASTATVLMGRCRSSLLPWLTSAQAAGHRRSWQSAGETARAWLSLQSAGERSEARRCPSACREGRGLLSTEVAAEWQPCGRVTTAGHQSPQWQAERTVPPNPGAAAAPPVLIPTAAPICRQEHRG